MVELAKALGVTYDLTPSPNSHKDDLVNIYARWKIANDAPGVAKKLLSKYEITTKMARAVTMEKSSYSLYTPWFKRATGHPDLLKFLEGEVSIHHSSQIAIWGSRTPALAALKEVIPELDAAKAKAAAKASKAAAAPVASGSGSKMVKGKARKVAGKSKGSNVLQDVPVLAASCTACDAVYWPDRKVTGDSALFHNNACYLKVGKQLWVDRTVSKAVLNAFYSFHASNAAIAEFWTTSFTHASSGGEFVLTREQVWKTFVSESIRQVAASAGAKVKFSEPIRIDELVKSALLQLGDNGIIRNVAALVGNDERNAVPQFTGTVPADVHTSLDDSDAMDVDETSSTSNHSELETPLGGGSVQLIVIDGIVMGPRKQRVLRRTQEEQQDWLLPATAAESHPHDDGTLDQPSGTSYNNYFSAPRFYCVETICAPCGTVIAWRKFAKSESESKILKFLQDVYAEPSSRPSYVAIDKGCSLLKHIAAQGQWDEWMKTTRFIVDAYHYVNHRTTDYLCRTWCNPAPLNGSAPNLVVVDKDKEGKEYYKRAFNTEACEQLNAWLGGFQSTLNRMTVSNFDWTIHVMLFLHSQRIMSRIEQREEEERQKKDALNDANMVEDEDNLAVLDEAETEVEMVSDEEEEELGECEEEEDIEDEDEENGDEDTSDEEGSMEEDQQDSSEDL
ncbi:hypothetical protein ONZ45_g12949 [Pleurotus djamor]|nr:hypothetical protein ONZ45_g12949 [Pleurotus djamor]